MSDDSGNEIQTFLTYVEDWLTPAEDCTSSTEIEYNVRLLEWTQKLLELYCKKKNNHEPTSLTHGPIARACLRIILCVVSDEFTVPCTGEDEKYVMDVLGSDLWCVLQSFSAL